jgi:hypothetical protein
LRMAVISASNLVILHEAEEGSGAEEERERGRNRFVATGRSFKTLYLLLKEGVLLESDGLGLLYFVLEVLHPLPKLSLKHQAPSPL